MTAAKRYSRLKVMGERGSGTNFLTQMLHANFEIDLIQQPNNTALPETNFLRQPGLQAKREGAIGERLEDHLHFAAMHSHGGWKHACLTERFFKTFKAVESTLVVCIVRHPAPWAASLQKAPFATFLEAPETLEAFLTQPWVTRLRDDMPAVILESPALLWRHKVGSYLDYAAQRSNVVVLRHEDLLRDHRSVLERLSEKLTPRDDHWRLVTSHGRNWTGDKRDFEAIRAELPDDPFDAISAEAAEILRRHIPDELLSRAGYV